MLNERTITQIVVVRVTPFKFESFGISRLSWPRSIRYRVFWHIMRLFFFGANEINFANFSFNIYLHRVIMKKSNRRWDHVWVLFFVTLLVTPFLRHYYDEAFIQVLPRIALWAEGREGRRDTFPQGLRFMPNEIFCMFFVNTTIILSCIRYEMGPFFSLSPPCPTSLWART